MQYISETSLDDGIIEHRFILGQIPGILWTPPEATASAPVPLILVGHPGGIARMYPRILGRVRRAVDSGFAAATIELPGSGERLPLTGVEQARIELRRALTAGEPVTEEIIARLVLPLVDEAVPEWQATLDALQAIPGLGGPIGYSGGLTAIGVRLALVEPRIAAAGLFAGSFIPAATLAEAQQVTIPLHVLLQWDDEGNDRQAALNLFDAFESKEKTLQANMGGHTGVPPFAGEDAARFFERHLRR